MDYSKPIISKEIEIDTENPNLSDKYDTQQDKSFQEYKKKYTSTKEDPFDKFSVDEIIELAERAFEEFALYLNSECKSLRQLYKNYIFDGKSKGKEVELISKSALIDGIKKIGFDNISQYEVRSILAVMSKGSEISDPESVEFQDLVKVLEGHGIKDIRPQFKKHLDFNQLSAKSYRVMNKLSDYII